MALEATMERWGMGMLELNVSGGGNKLVRSSLHELVSTGTTAESEFQLWVGTRCSVKDFDVRHLFRDCTSYESSSSASMEAHCHMTHSRGLEETDLFWNIFFQIVERPQPFFDIKYEYLQPCSATLKRRIQKT